jgi:3-oxoadipate enol-lactonase
LADGTGGRRICAWTSRTRSNSRTRARLPRLPLTATLPSLQPVATATLAVDGGRLLYEDVGTGPAVVLIHGFSLDMRMWDPQMRDLAAGFRVIRYDARGFGASGPLDPAVPYSHATDLLALLDHLSVEQAALVGFSFGGQVALTTALLAPARMRALVLLDSLLDGVPWDDESKAGLAELQTQVAAGGVAAGREAWLAHPLFAAARQRPEVRAKLEAMVADYPGQHWLSQDPHLPDSPPIDRLDQLTMPALVIAGERDVPGFLAMTDLLYRRLPDAECVLIPDAGHMVNLEQPAAVTALLMRFLLAHSA